MKKITLVTISLLTLVSFQSVKADDTTTQPTESQTEQTEQTAPNTQEQPSELLGVNYYIGENMDTLNYDDSLNLEANTSYTILIKARYTLDVPKGAAVTLNYNGTQSVPLNSNGVAYVTFTTGADNSSNLAYIGLSDDSMLPFTINVQSSEQPTTEPEQPTQESTVQESTEPTQETPTQESTTQESPEFVTDILPQTGSKDTLGDILQIVGLVLYAVLVAVITYMVVKRRNKNVK